MLSLVLPSWAWAVFTVIAAGAQTARNAMQSDLVSRVGTQGETYVRFLFGLPFALLFLGLAHLALSEPVPMPSLATLLWAAMGALAQTLATGLMLLAMRERSFVVTIAFTKTEPVIVALLSIVLLKEVPSLLTMVAIGVATAGVLLMSWPKSSPSGERSGMRAALIGLASGACFGASATSYRGAIIELGAGSSFIMTASLTMVLGLIIQCVAILAWLILRDRPLLMALLKNWRPSLFAGFMGALASQFWFLGFAITSAARVRTLALVEVLFAQIVSRRIFKERMSRAELGGMALIVVGVILLLNG
jgi:drug/metabolite transporter (DMT)-like permease